MYYTNKMNNFYLDPLIPACIKVRLMIFICVATVRMPRKPALITQPLFLCLKSSLPRSQNMSFITCPSFSVETLDPANAGRLSCLPGALLHALDSRQTCVIEAGVPWHYIPTEPPLQPVAICRPALSQPPSAGPLSQSDGWTFSPPLTIWHLPEGVKG